VETQTVYTRKLCSGS